jgi:hypothetical protein
MYGGLPGNHTAVLLYMIFPKIELHDLLPKKRKKAYETLKSSIFVVLVVLNSGNAELSIQNTLKKTLADIPINCYITFIKKK